MKEPLIFFENALKNNIRLFRSKSVCRCDDCINNLSKGIIPTTDEDALRFFKEQKSGVIFTLKLGEIEPKVINLSSNRVRQPETRAKGTNTNMNKRILRQLKK
jgi:hypothetical protein